MNIDELKQRALQGDDSACYGRRSEIRIVPPEIKLSK